MGFKYKNKNNWELDMDICDDMSLDVLREILELGVIRFRSIINDYNNLKSRCFTLLAIIISICGALIPILITREFYGDQIYDQCLGILVVICLIASAYAIWNYAIILFPRRLKIAGEEPKSMSYDSIVGVDHDDQKFYFLINRIEAIQDKIDFNETILQKCNTLFARALLAVGLAYVITLVYTVVKFLL